MFGLSRQEVLVSNADYACGGEFCELPLSRSTAEVKQEEAHGDSNVFIDSPLRIRRMLAFPRCTSVC